MVKKQTKISFQSPLHLNDNMLVELPIEILPDFDQNQNKTKKDDEHTINIPDEIGILPVRNIVVYPGTITPLAVGRASSKKLLASMNEGKGIIGLLTQRDSKINAPRFKDLYSVGTIASILKIIKMPQGTLHVVLHGLTRFKVVKPIATKPYLKAKIEILNTEIRKTKNLQAMMLSVRQTAERVISLSPNVPEEATVLLANIDNPSALADFLAANIGVDTSTKQKLLEQTNATKRLKQISLILANQLEVLELSHKIQNQVMDSVDKNQREFYLQEQLKAIQSELGQKDFANEEMKSLTKKIDDAKIPPAVKAEAQKELERLKRIHPSSPEYSVIRTYLDWVCQLPWAIKTIDQLDINKASKQLNRDHYGLEKVKKRILEFLAVRKLNPKGKSPILCFIGPPGVGKTSLGRSIARAMGRKFIRISLGGIRDEADIRGHRRTYIGALPGRILQEIRKAGSSNPVFMLDELDKVGSDFRGDPASALLEVLDPEQNFSFNDHYLDQPFDLSAVMFIGTANDAHSIPSALFDRMEIIELTGYTDNEKLGIAKKYLVGRQLSENGLKKTQLMIKDDALMSLIRSYTAEAGVRNLERQIAAICRNIATDIAKGNKRRATIGASALSAILGPKKFESELALRSGVCGVATGLAYTTVGGEILFIESAFMDGSGKFELTGQIGDVMKESAQAAFTVVKSNAKKLGLDPKIFAEKDFHIHVPEGAVPKDGPSAGIAMYTSLVSLLLHKPAKPKVAMTGEITLHGLVLPIGGLKEKILAAKQAGITTVILPYRNKKDMVDVPTEAKKSLKFEFVKNLNQAIKISIG